MGVTRGTHLGLTMGPSGPHMGSPYGPQVGPMRVAQGALYGWPTWDPDIIGKGGHKGPIRVRHMGPIWPPLWPIWAPRGQSIRAPGGPMRVAHMAPHGRPTWDPDRIGQGATRGPYRPDTWDPSGHHHGPIWAPHGKSIPRG